MADDEAMINHPDFGPLSPDEWLDIVTYTPSKEPQEIQEFFGRRQLRIMNGQLPVYHACKFTPEPNLVKSVWPTDAEAEAWAEAAKKSRAKRSLGAALAAARHAGGQEGQGVARDGRGCRAAAGRGRHCGEPGAFRARLGSSPTPSAISPCVSPARQRRAVMYTCVSDDGDASCCQWIL